MSVRSKIMKSLPIVAATVLAGIATPLIAHAGPQASGTYQLRAHVPVACWVRPVSPLLAENGRVGQVVEACNSPGGFTVSASYRPLSSTETASFNYGSRQFKLNANGNQELRRSNMATINTVDYRFEDVTLDQPLVLSLTIQPI
jgi:hypothetical protein